MIGVSASPGGRWLLGYAPDDRVFGVISADTADHGRGIRLDHHRRRIATLIKFIQPAHHGIVQRRGRCRGLCHHAAD